VNKAMFRHEVSVLSAALVVSIVISVSVLVANLRLRSEIRDLHTSLDNQAMVEAPQEGSYLKVLKGTDKNGGAEQIDLTSLHSSTFAIVMSPQCRYCRAELSTWNHLLQINRTARPLFINLSEQDDTGFLSSLRLPANTLHINIDRLEASSHYFQVTPTTLVIDSHGKVIWSWPGRLTEDQTAYLEHLLQPL